MMEAQEALDKTTLKWWTKSFLPAICILITGVIFLSQNILKNINLCYSLACPDMECCAFLPRSSGLCGEGRGYQFAGCLGGRIHATPFFPQDAIVIHEVYEEGAAARDGRLWAGDQILEVNKSHCICACLYLCCVYSYSTQHRVLVGEREII